MNEERPTERNSCEDGHLGVNDDDDVSPPNGPSGKVHSEIFFVCKKIISFWRVGETARSRSASGLPGSDEDSIRAKHELES